MRLTVIERLEIKAFNEKRCRTGLDFLEHLIFCGGSTVIVKGKFDIASRAENKLIFNTIRPYNEIINTLPKICDELSFPIDTLWKFRILEKADSGNYIHKNPCTFRIFTKTHFGVLLILCFNRI